MYKQTFIQHKATAKPAFERVCAGCQLIHPAIAFRNTPIEGYGRDCAILKLKREGIQRRQARALRRTVTESVVTNDVLERLLTSHLDDGMLCAEQFDPLASEARY